MLNQTVLVGRIVSDPQLNETKNERKITTITLAVSRCYKNEDGIYETDFIPCSLWGNIAENTCNYCKKGDLVGVKGRIQRTKNKLEIIAEKLTFFIEKGSLKWKKTEIRLRTSLKLKRRKRKKLNLKHHLILTY